MRYSFGDLYGLFGTRWALEISGPFCLLASMISSVASFPACL